jgi:hypothetical protein
MVHPHFRLVHAALLIKAVAPRPSLAYCRRIGVDQRGLLHHERARSRRREQALAHSRVQHLAHGLLVQENHLFVCLFALAWQSPRERAIGS